jgi:hypothetical protein
MKLVMPPVHSFVSLLLPHLQVAAVGNRSSNSLRRCAKYPAIRDSSTAFDEVFRGLLGVGVDVMIAGAIARMSYHTARKQKIQYQVALCSLPTHELLARAASIVPTFPRARFRYPEVFGHAT